MSTTRPEPTEAELRHAWAHCKRTAQSPWPATFEQAMVDPTLSRLVRLTAIHPPRTHRKAPEIARPRMPAQAPAPRNPKSLPLPGVAPGYFDRKRAAAGDRDDD